MPSRPLSFIYSFDNFFTERQAGLTQKLLYIFLKMSLCIENYNSSNSKMFQVSMINIFFELQQNNISEFYEKLSCYKGEYRMSNIFELRMLIKK